MEITAITNFDLLLPYRDKWNALLEKTETNTVFQSFEWHQAWWQSFSAEKKLFILLATEEKQLIWEGHYREVIQVCFNLLV